MERSKSAGARLRELFAGEPFLAGDCYNGITARIVEHIGFPAAYMGGHASGVTRFAIPDYGILTPTEMIDHARVVAEVIDIPLICDADEAGESVDNVFRTIRRFEAAGLAGVHIEDEIHPKHSTFDGPLLTIPEMQRRIEAAVKGRRSDDFVIIARSNEFQSTDPKGLGRLPSGGGSGSLEVMIARGVAYAEAGADAFIPTFSTEEDLNSIVKEVHIPLGDYQGLLPGHQFNLFTGYGWSNSIQTHFELASYVFANNALPPGRVYNQELKDALLKTREYDAVIDDWAEKSGRKTRVVQ
jgi:2-methylisocitrate lyase-like PEP mutase family enzyme